MIKRFNEFIKESNNNNILMYYAFDWDDNILKMPTKIHVEKKEGDSWISEDVSTEKWALIRNDKENYRLASNAFSDFRDDGPRGDKAFLEDVITAIKENRKSPSWNNFIECLCNGSLFTIITARGHESYVLRSGVEWIIDNVLDEEQLYEMYNNLLKFSFLFKKDDGERILRGIPSKNKLIKSYLDNCDFVGISAPSRGGDVSNPEKAKEEALLNFIDKVNKFASMIGFKVMIGFSDDDLKNVKHIEDLIDNLSNENFSNLIKFSVYGTKNPDNITIKTKEFQTNEKFKDWLYYGLILVSMGFLTPNVLSQNTTELKKEISKLDDFDLKFLEFVDTVNREKTDIIDLPSKWDNFAMKNNIDKSFNTIKRNLDLKSYPIKLTSNYIKGLGMNFDLNINLKNKDMIKLNKDIYNNINIGYVKRFK